MSDAWEPFDRLRDSIAAALPHGVHFEHWALIPGRDGERKAQLILRISPEAFQSEEERLLAGIEEATRIEEARTKVEQKKRATREKLRQTLESGNRGFLDAISDDVPPDE